MPKYRRDKSRATVLSFVPDVTVVPSSLASPGPGSSSGLGSAAPPREIAMSTLSGPGGVGGGAALGGRDKSSFRPTRGNDQAEGPVVNVKYSKD